MSRALVNKNLLANALNQVLGVGFPIVIQYYLIRHLNLEDLGYWNIINSSKAIVLLFIGFFNIFLIKVLAETKEKEKQGEYLTNSIVTIYLVLAIPFTVFLVYMLTKYDILFEYILISAVSILTMPLSSEYYFQASLKNNYLFYRRLAVRILYIVTLFLFVKDQSDFIIYAYIASFSLSLEHLLNLWFIRGFIKLKSISLKLIGSIFKSSVGFLPFMITFNLMPNISILAGDYFLDLKVLAIFSVLFKLINLATTFITSAIMVLFPYKLKMAENKESRFKDAYYLRNTILAAIAVILGLYVTRNIVFNIFLDDYTMPNLDTHFLVLSFYILIHAIYNYLAFNHYLVNGKSVLITLVNCGIMILFFIEIGLAKIFNYSISFSWAVVLPALAGLIFILIHSISKGKVNVREVLTAPLIAK